MAPLTKKPLTFKQKREKLGYTRGADGRITRPPLKKQKITEEQRIINLRKRQEYYWKDILDSNLSKIHQNMSVNSLRKNSVEYLLKELKKKNPKQKIDIKKHKKDIEDLFDIYLRKWIIKKGATAQKLKTITGKDIYQSISEINKEVIANYLKNN
jgi:hypothetical protein